MHMTVLMILGIKSKYLHNIKRYFIFRNQRSIAVHCTNVGDKKISCPIIICVMLFYYYDITRTCACSEEDNRLLWLPES